MVFVYTCKSVRNGLSQRISGRGVRIWAELRWIPSGSWCIGGLKKKSDGNLLEMRPSHSPWKNSKITYITCGGCRLISRRTRKNMCIFCVLIFRGIGTCSSNKNSGKQQDLSQRFFMWGIRIWAEPRCLTKGSWCIDVLKNFCAPILLEMLPSCSSWKNNRITYITCGGRRLILRRTPRWKCHFLRSLCLGYRQVFFQPKCRRVRPHDKLFWTMTNWIMATRLLKRGGIDIESDWERREWSRFCRHRMFDCSNLHIRIPREKVS